jgi:hypothetical protein
VLGKKRKSKGNESHKDEPAEPVVNTEKMTGARA